MKNPGPQSHGPLIRKARMRIVEHRHRNLFTLAFAAALLVTSSCSNDEGDGVGGNDGTGATNGMGATGGDGGLEPFRGAVLCTAVFAPDRTGFIRLVPQAELDPGDEIDAFEGAIEVAGGVSCATWENAVFAASFESPTITRYDVVDGQLVRGETVSFINFGVTSLAGLSEDVQVFSDTKAYFLDPATSQIRSRLPAPHSRSSTPKPMRS